MIFDITVGIRKNGDAIDHRGKVEGPSLPAAYMAFLSRHQIAEQEIKNCSVYTQYNPNDPEDIEG